MYHNKPYKLEFLTMLKKSMKLVYWFKELSKKDVDIAGGKGANLAEMASIRLPVPPGFIVSSFAYQTFVEKTKIQKSILKKLEDLDMEDTELLQKTSEEIQQLILDTRMPMPIQEAIITSYKNMSIDIEVYKAANNSALDFIKQGRDIPSVAVRSSATAEDLPTASFAGQNATLLNVKGADNVVKAVQECWASLFTARSIYYRTKNNFPHDKVYIAVVIQKMVNSTKSGIMFSINPVTNNKEEIIIEGGFGLGEAIVSGSVTPDNYVVNKTALSITQKNLRKQEWMFQSDFNLGRTIKRTLSEERSKQQKLTDEEIIKLASLAKKIEAHYGCAQDMEFAIEDSSIYIVQARPVTTTEKDMEKKTDFETPKGEAILTGLSASPGISSGKVKIVREIEDLQKVQKGDVLVAVMTKPDFVVAMERAIAIVTDEGGSTSHAAIISRELGIPCVVGTGKATQILKDDQDITVDAYSGKIYLGAVKIEHQEKAHSSSNSITKTKIYMNLGIPEEMEKYKDFPFDGIGLMRIEFIIASHIKEHPLHLIKLGRQHEYINKLAEGISKVASIINPKPVIVRFSDFKTNEYSNLEGGKDYEPKEENPLIGWRGVSRYVSEEFKEAFFLECQAIKQVRDSGLKNVHSMLPFVRTTEEVEHCLSLMESQGLVRNADYKIALMAEVPSIIFAADKFCKYADFFSIGSNDLTGLILGVDRDSSILGKMHYFDERNIAVLRAIEHLIKIAHKNNVKVSICGQAPSEYPEMVDFLVRNKIDSMSVNPDVVSSVREQVAEAEKRLILDTEFEL